MEVSQTSGQLMLFAEASRNCVKTSPSPERAQALKASAAAYGKNTPELLVNFDPDTSSWRTSQRCLIEGWTLFSETWPRSGTMRSGIAYQLPPLVRLTDATGSGLWPTPHANCSTGAGRQGRDGGDNLQTAVQTWPLPTSRDYKDGSAKACANVPSNGLLGREVHRAFPTPMARDAHNRSGQAKRYLEQGRVNLQDRNAADGISGSLNPTWVEWLMGFPLGWTVLEASATPSSRKSRKSSDAPS